MEGSLTPLSRTKNSICYSTSSLLDLIVPAVVPLHAPRLVEVRKVEVHIEVDTVLYQNQDTDFVVDMLVSFDEDRESCFEGNMELCFQRDMELCFEADKGLWPWPP